MHNIEELAGSSQQSIKIIKIAIYRCVDNVCKWSAAMSIASSVRSLGRDSDAIGEDALPISASTVHISMQEEETIVDTDSEMNLKVNSNISKSKKSKATHESNVMDNDIKIKDKQEELAEASGRPKGRIHTTLASKHSPATPHCLRNSTTKTIFPVYMTKFRV